MPKVDPRDFLLNTDYEMDKIIFAQKIERTVSSQQTITIAHKLPTAPLIFGVWSLNSDMSDARGFTQGRLPDGAYCYASSTNTDILITLNPKTQNGNPVSSTFHIYVYGFEPGDNHAETGSPVLVGQRIPATSKYADTFILNTDYNYMKLLNSHPEFSAPDQNGKRVFKHNLGYLPFIMSWSSFGWSYENNKWVIDFNESDQFSYNSGYKSGYFVTDEDVIYYGSGIVPTQTEVRIYADET